jgi:hypothetical protein
MEREQTGQVWERLGRIRRDSDAWSLSFRRFRIVYLDSSARTKINFTKRKAKGRINIYRDPRFLSILRK